MATAQSSSGEWLKWAGNRSQSSQKNRRPANGGPSEETRIFYFELKVSSKYDDIQSADLSRERQVSVSRQVSSGDSIRWSSSTAGGEPMKLSSPTEPYVPKPAPGPKVVP